MQCNLTQISSKTQEYRIMLTSAMYFAVTDQQSARIWCMDVVLTALTSGVRMVGGRMVWWVSVYTALVYGIWYMVYGCSVDLSIEDGWWEDGTDSVHSAALLCPPVSGGVSPCNVAHSTTTTSQPGTCLTGNISLVNRVWKVTISLSHHTVCSGQVMF